MKITKVFKRLVLGKWEKVDLKNINSFYLIGIKNKSHKKDIVDSAKVKKIKFELAVDTGVKNKYITVGYLNLNFDDTSSSDIELNKSTGYVRYINGPSKFFIRANDIIDASNVTYKEGKAAITININPQSLN